MMEWTENNGWRMHLSGLMEPIVGSKVKCVTVDCMHYDSAQRVTVEFENREKYQVDIDASVSGIFDACEMIAISIVEEYLSKMPYTDRQMRRNLFSRGIYDAVINKAAGKVIKVIIPEYID